MNLFRRGRQVQVSGPGSQSIQVRGNGSMRVMQAGRDILISDGTIHVDNKMYGPADESGTPAWIQVNKDMLADAWDEGMEAGFEFAGDQLNGIPLDPPRNPYR